MDDDEAIEAAVEELEEAVAEVRLAETLGSDTGPALAEVAEKEAKLAALLGVSGPTRH